MKPRLGQILILIFAILLGNITSAKSNSQEDEIAETKLANESCFKCHGQKKYFYYNPELDREIKKSMCPDRIIKADEYYSSNHRTFTCNTCHSDDYSNFPHSGGLRMEEKLVCIDCHGGDEDWAKYKFEEIEEEFVKSVHSTSYDEAFSCWMCHDPHSYHITLRTDSVLSNTIAYDNSICLSCHANIDKYQLLTDKINPNVLTTHEWLPNQTLHFLNVRCIECHVEIRDDIMVGHNIRPKEEAIHDCIECHSSDSRLMTTLYKHRVKETRTKNGFLNGVMVDDTFVIGANRNPILNKGSVIIFLLTIGGILIHGFLRIITVKK